jgi:anti-sigma regulatory factor (Ser/Thr protein kinase)
MLRPGDSLVFYTDGVIEAFNALEECYGSERLLAEAGALAGQTAPAITAGLLRSVRAFEAGAPSSDDVAIVTMSVAAPSASRRTTLELRATPAEVMRAVEALQEFGRGTRASESARFGLALALEECASNVVNHALLRDERHGFRVSFEVAGDALLVELRDRGPEFDPTQAPAGDQFADDDLPPGGWGIPLARRYTDVMEYTREGDENVLRLGKRFGAQADS